MHMAFLITWARPPAARQAHLGTERNVCAKSKGGWERMSPNEGNQWNVSDGDISSPELEGSR